jgi:hypothetical protein
MAAAPTDSPPCQEPPTTHRRLLPHQTQHDHRRHWISPLKGIGRSLVDPLHAIYGPAGPSRPITASELWF